MTGTRIWVWCAMMLIALTTQGCGEAEGGEGSGGKSEEKGEGSGSASGSGSEGGETKAEAAQEKEREKEVKTESEKTAEGATTATGLSQVDSSLEKNAKEQAKIRDDISQEELKATEHARLAQEDAKAGLEAKKAEGQEALTEAEANAQRKKDASLQEAMGKEEAKNDKLTEEDAAVKAKLLAEQTKLAQSREKLNVEQSMKVNEDMAAAGSGMNLGTDKAASLVDLQPGKDAVKQRQVSPTGEISEAPVRRVTH